MKVKKTKTTYQKEGLELAVYLANNFIYLKKDEPINLKAHLTYEQKIQKYLDIHTGRMHENYLRGIICVTDPYKNATGGRIHLIAGLQGPVIEAVQSNVISQPIDYEAKNRYLKRLLNAVSDEPMPKAGNIHFHLFYCNRPVVRPIDISHFISKEHGVQNDLQLTADIKMSVLVNLASKPYWRKNVDRVMLQTLFGKGEEL